MIDSIDRKILQILQINARLSNAEIARRVGMAASAIFERIRRLEEKGVITGYRPKLDPKALELGLLAYVFVRAEELPGDSKTGQSLASLPEVLEVHHIAGEDCYLTKVRTLDTEALGTLLREKFGAIPSVRSTRTTIVLSTIKDQASLPLDLPDDSEEGA